MSTNRFKLETTSVTSRLSHFSLDADNANVSSSRGRQIHRVLLRTLLNTQLSASNQSFLDAEAPPQCLAFLMRESEYLHPAGVELFPFEIIESAVGQGGDAIFTHLYRDEFERHHRPYRILTSILNPHEASRLIFGFFGPSHILSDALTMDRFARLTGEFRRGLTGLRSIISDIEEEWNSTNPILLMEKESGEPVALTSEFAREAAEFGICVSEDRSGDLWHTMAGLFESRQVTITDHQSNDYAISAVKLGSRHVPKNQAHDIYGAMTDEILARTANIVLATSQITGNANKQLAHIVGAETEAINQAIRRITLLVSFDDIPKREQSLYHELEHVADRLRPRIGEQIKLIITGFIDSLNILAPTNAVYALYESILLSHAEYVGGIIETTVTFDLHSSNRGLSIGFNTTLPPAFVMTDNRPIQHQQYAGHLAARMGMGIGTSRNVSTGHLLTTLTVNDNRRMRN